MAPRKDPSTALTFTLTCLEGEECTVAFEPIGTEYTLRSEDVLVVTILGKLFADVEISYSPGYLIVCLWVEGKVRVTNKAGEEIPL